MNSGAVTYDVCVAEDLDDRWSDWLGDVTFTHNEDGSSTLTVVADQARLHGLLAGVRDIGVTLVSVHPHKANLDAEQSPEPPPAESQLTHPLRSDRRIVLRYERLLDHPVDTVWRAITDPEAINAWWGTRPELDLRVGGEYVSRHATGDRVVDRIVRLEPPRVLTHTFWQHLNPEALVTYELQTTAEGALLVLTHDTAESDLRTAAAAVSWDGDIYDFMSRTAAGWPRLLNALSETLGSRQEGTTSAT